MNTVIRDEVLDAFLARTESESETKMGTKQQQENENRRDIAKTGTMAVTIDSVNSKFYCNTIKANDDCWYRLYTTRIRKL